ncbi:hypothetical protein F4810DRAFT_260946 [Camillea tinctor]|nr:hypothetical protein F4810DRAFT_260946 [Camillea tinctor]
MKGPRVHRSLQGCFPLFVPSCRGNWRSTLETNTPSAHGICSPARRIEGQIPIFHATRLSCVVLSLVPQPMQNFICSFCSFSLRRNPRRILFPMLVLRLETLSNPFLHAPCIAFGRRSVSHLHGVGSGNGNETSINQPVNNALHIRTLRSIVSSCRSTPVTQVAPWFRLGHLISSTSGAGRSSIVDPSRRGCAGCADTGEYGLSASSLSFSLHTFQLD